MGIKELFNGNLRKLPNEYGDVSVMLFLSSLLIPDICRQKYKCHQNAFYNTSKFIKYSAKLTDFNAVCAKAGVK